VTRTIAEKLQIKPGTEVLSGPPRRSSAR